MRLLLRKYGIVLLMLLGGLSSLRGQINPTTAFYWENPYFINPASVNLDYSGFFSLAARKQWTGIRGTPLTFSGTGTYYFDSYNTQVGIKALKDEIGYVSTMDVALSYAYILRLSWNSFLNMGLSGAYQVQSIDKGEVTLEDMNDPIWSDSRLNGIKEWNASLGVEYIFDKVLTLGLSSQNLLSFFKRDPFIWGGTNYMYARYRTRSLGRGFDPGYYRTRSFPISFDMEYGVCLKHYKDDFQVDGMISFYINRQSQEEMVQLSLLGRSVGEIGILAGVKLISDLKLLCSYDYNFKAVNGRSSGTFEIILTYPIRRNNICRSEWDMF
ncbi:PorP/SprF family type IX secretion system membrane protein [Porphyromonadaceae bacterium OttesenSCG-928-L07]|nr:PorP/SprF family type IX secretion system membrane protein [Porphyromonadaceae bacterium OttesenSCG-928-L07]MDL2252194.1 PorP/SprF family type IX secretion system membrane protein [Odoribacter sp. OttesenSCG-928-J03]